MYIDKNYKEALELLANYFFSEKVMRIVKIDTK